jgi:uncharacterized membrane protein YozB (DUF420 family)
MIGSHWQPFLNACLNLTSAVLLVTGYAFIRKGNVPAHKRTMLAAVATSILFLVSYLVYHYMTGSTKYRGEGILRTVYLAILGSHTVLAAIVPILAAVVLIFAFRRKFSSHRKWARKTLPIWLYVSVTGVVVYLMLYHGNGAGPQGD